MSESIKAACSVRVSMVVLRLFRLVIGVVLLGAAVAAQGDVRLLFEAQSSGLRGQSPAPAVHAGGNDGSPTAAEEVLQRMAEARKAIRSASYEIRRQKKFIQPIFRRDGEASARETGDVLVPANTLTIHRERFLVDGQKRRYDTDGPVVGLGGRPEEGGLTSSREIWTVDGEASCIYRPDKMTATIEEAKRMDFLGLDPLSQFHDGLRLLTTRAGMGVLRLDRKKDWGGHSCYVLVEEIGPLRCSYYIDPERDWVLVRQLQEVVAPEKQRIWNEDKGIFHGFGLLSYEHEISYEKAESGAWWPAGWTSKFWRQSDNGNERTLQYAYTAVIKRAELNIEFPEGALTVDLPDGTRVHDRRLDVAYTVDKSLSDNEFEAVIQQKVAQREQRLRQEEERERQRQEDEESRLKVGDVAPLFEFETADGGSLNLLDVRDKFVLLVFWRVQCSWGRLETPHLKATWDAFTGDDRFAMISVTSADYGEETIGWAAEKDAKWLLGFLDDESLRSLAGQYGVTNRGSGFLIGPDGKVVARNLRGEAAKKAVAKALSGR